jgi:hypothetical protein
MATEPRPAFLKLADRRSKRMAKSLIGETVHYVSRGSADGVFPSTCRAATITEVPIVKGRGAKAAKGSVDLAVLNPDGFFFQRGTAEDQDAQGLGTWHWPCDIPEEGPTKKVRVKANTKIIVPETEADLLDSV